MQRLPFSKWAAAAIAFGDACLLLLIDIETPIGRSIARRKKAENALMVQTLSDLSSC
jgi:hypothetical protein